MGCCPRTMSVGTMAACNQIATNANAPSLSCTAFGKNRLAAVHRADVRLRACCIIAFPHYFPDEKSTIMIWMRFYRM